MVLVMTISAAGCGTSLKKSSDLKYDLIKPSVDDQSCMSDALVDQILKHNCKLWPENKECKK